MEYPLLPRLIKIRKSSSSVNIDQLESGILILSMTYIKIGKLNTLSFFSRYIPNRVVHSFIEPKYILCKSSENLWIVKLSDDDDSLGIIQGMKEDGTRLLASRGYHPPLQNGMAARMDGGIADGAGGFWFLYHYPTSSNDYFGAPYADWAPPDGYDPEDAVRLVDNPILADLDYYYVMDNGDLVTISNHAAENIRHYYNTHVYRLQRVRHPLNLSLEEPEIIPKEFSITGAYPNPFNSNLRLCFNLPEPREVSLNVYDVCGRSVRSDNLGRRQAGENSYNFNATDLAAGVYVLRLSDGNRRLHRKVVLLK